MSKSIKPLDTANPLSPIVSALWEKAKEPGMSPTKVAASVDISEAWLRKLRDEVADPGSKFLRAVVSAYPDLEPVVIEYVLGRKECDETGNNGKDG